MPIVRGIAHDITERQQIEQALRDLEAKYRTLFNAIADPIFIYDRESCRFLDCNRAALDVYG